MSSIRNRKGVSAREVIFTMDLDQYTPAGYGDSVEYTKALAMAGTGTADVDEVPYSDAWGEFYSAYSPVMDSSGNNNFSAQTKSGRHLPEMCVTMETGSADCRWFRYDKWKQGMEVFDPSIWPTPPPARASPSPERNGTAST